MIDFVKYPSILNHYDNKELDYWKSCLKLYKNLDLEDIKWDVTEKIHGSNMSVIYDPKTKEVAFASRNKLLSSDTDGYPNAVQILKDNVVPKLEYITEQLIDYLGHANFNQVTLFGEFFGGTYPTELADKDPHAVRVQRGVFYSPHNHFRVFDISYRLEGEERIRYVPPSAFKTIAALTGLEVVPNITTCKNLKEALSFDISKLDSLVPVLSGLTAPDPGTNIVEGVVLKPLDFDLWCGEHRIIIKYKNEKFQEVAHEQKVKEVKELPENVKAFMEAGYIEQYVTEQRLNNVISHFGRELTIKDFSELCKEYVHDTLEDISKLTAYTNLSKDEVRMITKSIGRAASDKVRKYFIS